jgi:hypothetical protein
MTVYVDWVQIAYGPRVMCHMMSDTSEDELLAFADRIGVNRRWYQRPDIHKTGTPHFDICLAEKALAIKCGAVELKHPDDKELLLSVIHKSRAWYLSTYVLTK